MRKFFGILCFVLAFAALVAGINNVMRLPSLANPSEEAVSYSVGYTVGAFLPSLAFLIIGLWLLRKKHTTDK